MTFKIMVFSVCLALDWHFESSKCYGVTLQSMLCMPHVHILSISLLNLDSLPFVLNTSAVTHNCRHSSFHGSGQLTSELLSIERFVVSTSVGTRDGLVLLETCH